MIKKNSKLDIIKCHFPDKIDEKYLANYIIDFDKDIIKVNFTGTDGTSQEWTDKIEVIAKDRITSKIIQIKKNK